VVDDVLNDLVVHLRKDDNLEEGLKSSKELKSVRPYFVDQKIANTICSPLVNAAEIVVHPCFSIDFLYNNIIIFIIFLLFNIFQIFFA
jgi:hypothetical protein